MRQKIFFKTLLNIFNIFLFSLTLFGLLGLPCQQILAQQKLLRRTPQPALKQKSVPSNAEIKIAEIKVTGNRKIESDAIVSKLVSQVDQPYVVENLRRDVQALFDLGYFYDIQVDEALAGSQVVLTYHVVEKPSLIEIKFEGNKALDDDELREASQLKAYEIVNVSKIQEASEKLQKFYEDKGYFLARLTYKIVDVTAGETQSLTFHVEENDKVTVKKITFLGNHHLSDLKLKSQLQTQEGGFFSFISGSGSYKQDVFDRDVERISYLYFNEGYIDAKVDRPQVFVTPDKKGIFITIRITEGHQFEVGQIGFSGDLLFSEQELRDSIEIDESKIFVYDTLKKDIRELVAKYGDLGYAFTNVIPRTAKKADYKVDIIFDFDKGQKVYFGKISVVGNSRTRDKVIRRELTIREGELYNETRKRESMERVQRLGFFEEVNFNTNTPPERPDLLNIDIAVKERNTGSLQVGLGWSSVQKFMFNAQVSEINFLGRGQKMGFLVQYSKKDSIYNLNFTEPYFLDSEWSVGFDLYRTEQRFQPYVDRSRGGAIRIGHPLGPYLDAYLRYKLQRTDIELASDADPDLFPEQTVDGVLSSLTSTIEYDRRNDRFSPSKGIYASGSIEYAGLGGDLEFTKTLASFRYFKVIYLDLVWRNNLSYGLIASNVASKNAPFTEIFRFGGPRTLRGFDFGSIGQKRYSAKAGQDIVYGGTQKILFQTELEFPLISEVGFKGALFYDIGSAADSDLLGGLRSDLGFGFRWFSPIGPLRFEWGFPINKQAGELSPQFQIDIGTPF